MPVDVVGGSALPDWLRSTLDDPKPHCRHLVTLNPEYVMLARQDTAFGAAIQGADLVTADGIGIVLAARWMGPATGQVGRLERITGVDLIERICRLEGARVFLLGGASGTAAETARRLARHHSTFELAGVWEGGSADESDDAETLKRVAACGARVVLVAYGAPGQVLWIARNQRELATHGVRLAVGVGGAFDFLAGAVPRAPRWMRQGGLEWLYRLMREPWRWRRQRVLPIFATKVLAVGIRNRLRTIWS